MKGALTVLCVFFGCMGNMILLEKLVKEDPGCGNLITFSQFLFIAIEGFVFTSKFGRVRPHVGVSNYCTLVLLFFIVNFLNNYAFNFNVPVPLHIIFRSGSLLANMIMGVYILKKKYPPSKYLAVTLITIGIIICTFASGKNVKSTNPRETNTTPQQDFFWWTVGIIILITALLLSAMLGILQESLYSKYGKHPKEVLYYTHLLPLPLFVFLYQNIYQHAVIAYNSEPVLVFNQFSIPKTFVYLLGNILSQFFCISSVYTLTSECSSLVVTLVLTLRKFCSLIFSVLYFRNPFTLGHWSGTILVVIGTVLFTELHKKCSSFLPMKTKVLKKTE